MENRYHSNRHNKITATDNRHSHIYICENVGGQTVGSMSVNVGDFDGKMSAEKYLTKPHRKMKEIEDKNSIAANDGKPISKLKQEFPTLLDFQIYQAKEAEKRKRIKQSYKSKQKKV